MSKKSHARLLKDRLLDMRKLKDIHQDIVNTYAQMGECKFQLRGIEMKMAEALKKVDVLWDEYSKVDAIERAVAEKALEPKVTANMDTENAAPAN